MTVLTADCGIQIEQGCEGGKELRALHTMPRAHFPRPSGRQSLDWTGVCVCQPKLPMCLFRFFFPRHSNCQRPPPSLFSHSLNGFISHPSFLPRVIQYSGAPDLISPKCVQIPFLKKPTHIPAQLLRFGLPRLLGSKVRGRKTNCEWRACDLGKRQCVPSHT